MFKNLSYKNIFWIQIGWVIFLRLYNYIIPDPFLVAGGYGWDGSAHYRPMLLYCHMDGFIKSLDNYYIKKIFPFCPINWFLVNFFDNVTDHLALNSMHIWNFIMQIGSIIVYKKISEYHKLKKEVYFLGFVLLFVNWSFAKEVYYYHVLHTATLLFLSSLAYYAYIKTNIRLLFIVSLLLIITWPAGFYFVLILFLLPKGTNFFVYKEKMKNSFKLLLILVFLIFSFFSIKFFISQYNDLKINEFSDKNFLVLSTLINILFIGVLIYFTFNGYNILSFHKIVKHFKNLILTNYVLVLVCFCWVYLLSQISTNASSVNLQTYFEDIFTSSVIYPGIIFVSPFSYYGTALIFIVLFFKKYSDFIKEQGVGWLLIFSYGAMLLFLTEARQYNFLLFFWVIPILINLNQYQFKKNFIICVTVINLIISRFYLNIYYIATNIFGEEIHNADGGFPLNVNRIQLFISNYGRWTLPVYYYTYFFMFLITFSILYYLNKKYILNPSKK